MSTPSTPLPHFSGKNELSLQDLDALSNAVRAQGMTTELVPAAAHHGRRQYTGANFNLSQFDDACTGVVATPDKIGLIASASYSGRQNAPYIDNGNLVLPLAHDYSPSDSSLPDESATGGVATINVVDALKRPQINRGDIQLPLAQSSWPQTSDGAMYTPGLVYGVQYDPVDDACEGSVLPRIDQGIIHLPATGGGSGGDDTPTAGCSCVPAQFYDDVCTMGEICAVVYDEGISDPVIVDGTIRLPANADACPGTVASPLAGVINTAGTPVPWADMVEAPVRLCSIFDYETGIFLYLTGQFKNGYLQFSTELR